ncbi:3-deoxy-D-manno-octulosonic-acid transferase [Litorivivens lipolytica]|uniref:3-deoxy-D-manno-octulosonic acid transferase n=1 Tax=Litorivivens lipolytica TaxID=1524264 RepID=A0A7W4W6R5_9GAMM|nr:lipid IV(A) 3-deoxy-D-manno-octulosonic acid transferase [Litorivivens lipolytica]MBB3048360.1 3-deoxy-D-manno-octulosonic-acid transferase [Litorivivens lipolytica]
MFRAARYAWPHNSHPITVMPLFIYTCLFYLISPLLLLRLLQRSVKAPEYRRRMAERFGFFTAPPKRGGIWVHAVSVGEVIAAVPMIKVLQERYPEQAITVTTMTPTGSERVQAMLGDSVFHVYAPYDMPDAIGRFLRRTGPQTLVIMETEIWPNMVCCARRAGLEVVLANARLSEKSARGYARLPALTKRVFSAISMVVAQHRSDAERFRSLGVPDAQLSVSGSVKFDIDVPESLRQQAQDERRKLGLAGRPVWLCASTHEGEETLILKAFSQIREQVPEAALLIAPRHPERFDQVAALIASGNWSMVRRSSGDHPEGADILLLDTMGELMLLFGCADVATVGGSLIERGGHNSLEPAAWGLPLVNGPSDFNFAAISELLQQAGALSIVDTAEALASEVAELLKSEALREQRGALARQVVAENRGALERLLEHIDRLHH